MNCKNHKGIDAKFVCEKCRGPICEDCTVEVRGRNICRDCADKALFPEEIHAGKAKRDFFDEFLFFFCACIPGVGQLSMALFSRGMQLMITFIGAFVFFTYVNVESFIPLIVIPLWFYSFFDSYNLRKKLDSGVQVEDSLAYDYTIVTKNRKLLGIGMLVFGFIGLLNSFEFFNTYHIFGFKVRSLLMIIKRSVFPLLLVLAGFFLVSKAKKEVVAGAVEETAIEEA